MHWICFGICWAMGAKGTGDWGPPGGVVEQKSRQSVACIEFHWFMFHMSRLWGRDSLKAGAWHNRGMSTGWAAGWRSKSSGRVTMQWLHLLSIYVCTIYTHTPLPRNFRDVKGMPLLLFKKYFLQSFRASREKMVGRMGGGYMINFWLKAPMPAHDRFSSPYTLMCV